MLKLLLSLALMLTAAQAPAFSSSLIKVVRVIDGDTIVVRKPHGKKFKVRMSCIDAPELRQAGGRESKAHMQQLLDGHTVELIEQGTDLYGRTLGVVIDAHNDDCINLLMVKHGFAWDYHEVGGPYLLAQEEAQDKQLGIWANDAEPTPPWVFRKEKHDKLLLIVSPMHLPL
jgi:micrococcal nuclease